MVMQAYIDDSEGSDGTYVLAGHVATAEAWAAFSAEWEQMLPMGLRDERGWHFHMVEMAQLEERMKRVAGFYRIIEKHVSYSVAIRLNLADYKRAIRRIKVSPGQIKIGRMKHPFGYAFANLIQTVQNSVHFGFREFPDEPVDFIFDENSQKDHILRGWSAFSEGLSEQSLRNTGQTPIFRDDRIFLPLQAADLWAWWVRKWTQEGRTSQDIMCAPPFDHWQPNRHEHPKLMIDCSADHIANFFFEQAVEKMSPVQNIYDLAHPLPDGGRCIRMKTGKGS